MLKYELDFTVMVGFFCTQMIIMADAVRAFKINVRSLLCERRSGREREKERERWRGKREEIKESERE